MKFCTKCGKQLDINSKFCINCGNPIYNQSNQQEYVNTQNSTNVTNINTNTTNNKNNMMDVNYNNQVIKPNNEFIDLLNDVFNTYKRLLINPIDEIKNKNDLNQENVIIFMTISAILFGLFTTFSINSIITLLKEQFMYKKSFLSTLSGDNYYYDLINIPYMKIFISSSILFLISVCILWGVNTFIFQSLFQISIDNKLIIQKIVQASIPFIMSILIKAIVSFISYPISIMILISGMLISIILLYLGFNDLIKKKYNKYLYIFPIQYILILIVGYVFIINVFDMVDAFKFW